MVWRFGVARRFCPLRAGACLWAICGSFLHLLCVPRLLSPAIGLFLGFGLLAGRLPEIVGSAMLLLALLISALEAAFVAGGYWVV